MQNKKIDELLTVDFICELVEAIVEEERFLIDINTLSKINDILVGKEVVFEDTKGLIIYYDDGISWDLAEEVVVAEDDYYKRLNVMIGQNIREGYGYAEKLTIAHQEIDEICDIEGKSIKEREQTHLDLDERMNFEVSVEVDKRIERKRKFTSDNFYKLTISAFGKDNIHEYMYEYIESSIRYVIEFCSFNNLSIEIKNVLLDISRVHVHLAELIVFYLKCKLIEHTNYNEIVDCYGGWFVNNNNSRIIGIRPQKSGFFRHLIENVDKLIIAYNDDVLKRELVKYVRMEGEKMENYFKEDKQQTLINITPQQTLFIEAAAATVEDGKPNKKQPSAKVMMAFINLIDDRAKIIPKDCINNAVKFTTLSNKIKELFTYQYAGGTLEKEQYTLEGYSLEVYNLLTEWEYNTEAVKYKNRHNL